MTKGKLIITARLYSKAYKQENSAYADYLVDIERNGDTVIVTGISLQGFPLLDVLSIESLTIVKNLVYIELGLPNCAFKNLVNGNQDGIK